VVPSCRCQNEKVPENPLDLSVGCVWSNGRAYYAPWAAIWGAVGARWIVMALKAADQKSESFAKDVLSERPTRATRRASDGIDTLFCSCTNRAQEVRPAR
jgi:hypothetical protein